MGADATFESLIHIRMNNYFLARFLCGYKRPFPVKEKRKTDNSSMLTGREVEVLFHVQKGCTNKEIAKILSISCNTVKTHLDNIFRKLNVRNRTQAAMKAKNGTLTRNTS